MRAARIGVTCGAAGLKPAYRAAVEQAGGQVVELAPGRPVAIGEIDGLLLTGGADVDPARYGRPREPETKDPEPARDELELALVAEARRRGLPMFGICRGQQLLAVAFGGELVQHVEGHRDGSGSHPIVLTPGSRLRRLAGSESLQVNSRHHQVAAAAPPGLRVSARGPDGLVEGLESDDGTVLAVQCHPEDLVGESPWAGRLFADLVERATASARSRPSRAARARG